MPSPYAFVNLVLCVRDRSRTQSAFTGA